MKNITATEIKELEDKFYKAWSDQIRAKEDEKILKMIEEKMEEMAGEPREEMGKRQPGERNAYENYKNTNS